MSAPTLVRSFPAMASSVTLTVVEPDAAATVALDRAERVFREVERTCSRFDPGSALSLANAEPGTWHEVPEWLAKAVLEAARAHRETDGAFDPRILGTLLRWGYDRTLPFGEAGLEVPFGEAGLEVPSAQAGRGADGAGSGAGARPAGTGRTTSTRVAVSAPPAGGGTAWEPEVRQRARRWELHLGGEPIDLGGIGKGLAVRWAAAELAAAGGGSLVDAGGDGAVAGPSPSGRAWRVGIEDPAGGPDPVLVVEITDAAYATSSTRLRRWRVAGQQVHHLVDPRTRRPGGAGLAAVTVVGPDPAGAEVWSKTLFLAGADHVRTLAQSRGLAAAWVATDGAVGTTAAMDEIVIWRRGR